MSLTVYGQTAHQLSLTHLPCRATLMAGIPRSRISTCANCATVSTGAVLSSEIRATMWRNAEGAISVEPHLLLGYVGLQLTVFRVSQNPFNYETLDDKDFRGRSHFDAFRHPDPIIDARLLHVDLRAAQQAH